MPPSLDTSPTMPGEYRGSSRVGPVVGAIIIVCMLIVGAFYFYGMVQNRNESTLPLIPGDPSTSVSENVDAA